MTKHGPWKTLSTKIVHDTPWIRVESNDVINPGGFEGQYSTIHFKNLAIGILPIDKDGNVYLVGQYRYPIKAYSWEIPEGGGALDVDPIESAKRELKEEVGITAKSWQRILFCHLSNSASDEQCILYLATDLEFGEAEPEDDEDLVTRKIHTSEFIGMVSSGKITDSLTVMAALKLEIMLLRNELTI